MSEVQVEEIAKSFGSGSRIGPVSFSVRKSELLSLLGPSGCGKTTILRIIAGFIEPTAGTVRLQGADVTKTPPHRRNAALVFQNYALFPHLSVFENIAFGLRRRRIGRAEIAAKVDRLITMMRLNGLALRTPGGLSGGQQQRVALARALAIEPAVILLDEPFSSLDARLRETTRLELRAIQQELGFTAILVTHDQAEALSISDRLVVMRAGRIEQIGSAREIYEHPATAFVGDFVGRANRVPGGLLRPEAIHIVPVTDQGALPATVKAASYLGAASELLVLTTDGRDLIVLADGLAPSRYPPGSAIGLAWDKDSLIRTGESE
ncbi:MAG: ABC transporter ATP-binding protein [Acetobacteraceae bacterium]